MAAGAGAAGGGGGFDPKMLQQLGGMMGGGSQGGSQGNWMADIANAQKDAWTKYIDTTQQAPQMGMPAVAAQKTSTPQASPERAEKISAIKDYIDAATRAAELNKQKEEVKAAEQQTVHPAEK
jgi:hypothetical protein